MMYLWNLLQKSDNELIKKVYNTQIVISTKGDWAESIKKDRKDLEIAATDEEIAKMTKWRFKSIINSAVEKKALEFLNKTANEHSKSKKLMKNKLTCENYFLDRRFQKSDIELLFALKSRMINVKKNFASQFKDDIACDLCKVHVDCQEHLLQCHELTKNVFIPVDVKYEDLFKNSDKQLRIVKLFKKLLRKREILITKN